MNISFSDRVEVPTHVMARLLDKEVVFLNLETEQYYGLNETGTRMWQLVTSASRIEDAYAQLINEFDTEAEQLRQDLSELLGRLVEKGLIRVCSADGPSAPAISGTKVTG